MLVLRVLRVRKDSVVLLEKLVLLEFQARTVHLVNEAQKEIVVIEELLV